MNAAAMGLAIAGAFHDEAPDDDDEQIDELLTYFSFAELDRISKLLEGYDTDSLIKEYKDFKKEFPNNTLNKEEFKGLAKKSSWGKDKDEAILEQLFRAFDSDNSNSIDFKELVLGMVMCTSKNVTPEERLKFCFGAVDVDDNGHLSREEVENAVRILLERNKVVVEKLPPELDTAAKITAQIFLSVDRNVDNQLSPDELVAFMNTHPAKFKALGLDLIFNIVNPT